MQVPKAPKREKKITFHNDTREDPWFWLRDKDDPETTKYLQAENTYAKQFMQDAKEDELYKELRARIQEKDETVPVQDGEYYYYTRYEQGGQYPIFCRKKTSLKNEEEIILDVNELAKDQKYLEIGVCSVSPNHRFLAYSIDTDGSESFTLYVKDLETGKLLDTKIKNTSYSLAWFDSSQSFLYCVLDQFLRPNKVYRHDFDNAEDSLIYEEKDSKFFLGVHRSKSGQYLYVTIDGNNMSEWYYTKSSTIEDKLKLIQPRTKDLEYSVVDHENYFYIRNNGENAKDFRVSKAKVDSPSKEHWENFIEHKAGNLIQGIDAFKNYFLIWYRKQGLPQIHIIDFASQEEHAIDFSEECYEVYPTSGRQWDTCILRYKYNSLTTPMTVFDYNMKTRESVKKKQKVILGGFSSENYITKRIFAKANDGTQIPISLLYHKNTNIDGKAPLMLYSYGSYGINVEVDFRRNIFTLIDRGFIFAIAHIRGGMEMGWNWYENGKLLCKKNTFTDFINCAEHLIQEKYTSEGNIVAEGRSAGGLLMGAITNMRPEMFKIVIAHVPFVDALNTMLDDTLPLTPLEYNEWGNPQKKEYYDYIKSYSPYDNIEAKEYPNLLITGGLNDPRVTYWEPAKFAAKLRDTKTDSHTLLLKINMGAGHGGSSGRFDYLKEVAFDYGFILKIFQIEV